VSDPGRPIAEEELHAYVDDRLLDGDRVSAVQRYLHDHPDAARQVAAWRTQREALPAAFAAVAAEPIPARLGLERLIQQRLGRRATWRVAAATLLAFGLGGAGGWFLHSGLRPPVATITLLTQQAVANHVVYTADRRRPTELGAQQRDDLARWVSNRLNHQVAPPDLSADGFSYMGGRLAATPDGPAGLFMYDGPQGVRLTVFVLPLKAAASIPIQHVDFAHVDGCAWIDKSIGYTVVGGLPPSELRRIAELVRRQISGA
jgi:anti-sigma factor RsiW